MIYKSSLINKEIRQSYLDSLSSKKKLSFMCLFLAMLTIIVYLLLQIMYDSVLTELVPEVMLPSYFTIVYLYNWVAYIFFASYFMVKYHSMTLTEINENKWYMLTKMGFHSTKIILNKMLTTLFIVLGIYSAGYAAAILISSILKFTFVSAYFLPCFAAGALNILLTVEFILVISLFSKNKTTAKNRFLTTLFVSEALKIGLGYYKLITNRMLMMDAANLIRPEHSLYAILSLGVAVILPFFAYFGARRKSDFYTLKSDVGAVTIVSFDDNRVIRPSTRKRHKIFSLPSLFAKIMLMLVLIASILFNILILVASLGSSTNEFSVLGYIPYIIKSSTMEPEIYKNDLALFKKVDSQYPIREGDTVLFADEAEGSEVFIMKVVNVNGELITADYLKYPIAAGAGELQESVRRGSIYAVFFNNYRIIGAIILFINTFPGRMLTLFVPLMMLFFYPQIMQLYRMIKKLT